MQQRKEAEHLALAAFNDTIWRWQEALERSGGGLVELQAIDYASNVGQGKATHQTRVCCPTISDFVADVQLAAYKCLSGSSLALFHRHYRDAKLSHDAMPKEDRAEDRLLRIRLGRYFGERGLWPFEAYRTPLGIRDRRDPEWARHMALRKIGRSA